MKFDKPLVAAAIGAVSMVPGEVITRGLLSLGLGKYSVFELHSMVVTINRPSESMGFVVSCIIGAITAVVFYYAIGIIGQDYLVHKAVGAAILFWFAAEMIFTATIEGHFIDIRPISDYAIHFIGVVGYGITLGLLFNRYLFNSSPAYKKE